jgi:Uma2 family endonuclease
MNMSVVTQTMTAEELLRLPDDGYRYELVQGELRRMSPAGHEHGDIVTNIITHMNAFARSRGLGKVYSETGFVIARNPDTVRAPDVAFVRADRVVPRGPGYFPGAPDLAVEVISPTDSYTDVDEKTSEYLRAGCGAVIVVNPRTLAVHVHRAASVVKVTDTLEVDDVVPGWKMPLAEIFAE